MPRTRADEATPDRLAAVLEELEAVRRAPGWVPSEDSVLDEPRSRVADLPRRVAATRRAERERHSGRHAAGTGDDELRPREPLLRPPEPLVGAQVAPSRLAVIGALILMLVAGLVFGGRVLWAKASARPQPVTPTSVTSTGRDAGATASPSARPGFGAAGATTPTPNPTVLVVQVVGQVRRPGVVRVKPGSRVQDAVTAAGGALSGADLAAINLARLVADGEQIQVPRPGEHPTPPAGPPAPAGGSAGASGATSGGPAASVVDLNTADESALDGLPGVGPVTAQRILQWRTENGRFSSVDELGEVSGIGPKTLERLRPLVRVG